MIAILLPIIYDSGDFGVCYCWGLSYAVGAVRNPEGATMAPDGQCLGVHSETSRCLIRDQQLEGGTFELQLS